MVSVRRAALPAPRRAAHRARSAGSGTPRRALVHFALAGVLTEKVHSDEYFYLQMAATIKAGYRPYFDFFSAHMPLMLYPLAALFSLFGTTYWVGHLISKASSFVLLYLVYRIGEHRRPYAGVLAALLLFLTPTFHPYSHNAYGIFSSLTLAVSSPRRENE